MKQISLALQKDQPAVYTLLASFVLMLAVQKKEIQSIGVLRVCFC